MLGQVSILHQSFQRVWNCEISREYAVAEFTERAGNDPDCRLAATLPSDGHWYRRGGFGTE